MTIRDERGVKRPSRQVKNNMEKQPSRCVLGKRCSENIQQIYRRTPMPKCEFNKVAIKLQSNFIEIALWHGCSPLNLQHIFRTPFPRNTSGWLLQYIVIKTSEPLSSLNTSLCCPVYGPIPNWGFAYRLDVSFQTSFHNIFKSYLPVNVHYQVL